MSAVALLALGGSVGYLMFKRQTMEGRLEKAVRQWDGSGAGEATDGATTAEVKNAWRNVEHTRKEVFNERLPADEQQKLMNAERQHVQEVEAFDQSQGSACIQGVYLEQSCAF